MWALYKDSCFRLTESSSSEEKAVVFSSPRSPISLLSKLGQSLSRKRNPKVRTVTNKDTIALVFSPSAVIFLLYQDKKEKETDSVGKRRRTSQADQSEDVSTVASGFFLLVCHFLFYFL